MDGLAADIEVFGGGADRYRLLESARAAGIQRLGIAHDFLHVDVATDRPHPVVWTY